MVESSAPPGGDDNPSIGAQVCDPAPAVVAGGEDGDRADGAAARSRVKFGPNSGRPKGTLFLLQLLHELRLAGWRNDVLQPHVSDEVAVVFHSVDVVDSQRA